MEHVEVNLLEGSPVVENGSMVGRVVRVRANQQTMRLIDIHIRTTEMVECVVPADMIVGIGACIVLNNVFAGGIHAQARI